MLSYAQRRAHLLVRAETEINGPLLAFARCQVAQHEALVGIRTDLKGEDRMIVSVHIAREVRGAALLLRLRVLAVGRTETDSTLVSELVLPGAGARAACTGKGHALSCTAAQVEGESRED